MGGTQVHALAERVVGGGAVSEGEARLLIGTEDIGELMREADWITRELHGPRVDVEELANIKKNACSEDCSFCAQSALYDTGVGEHALAPTSEIVESARRARDDGASSYCLVAAWREPPPRDFERVCEAISEIARTVGIDVDCSLGFLTPGQARRLKGLGVAKYNHNLETARSKFPEICTTHTYDDRMDTLRVAREAGLGICTGGIIGMGETREQRLEMALDVASVCPDEVTINILTPMRGTPLELQSPLPEGEAERTFALYRFLCPRATVRVSGGRERSLRGGEAVLRGGANAIITSGYLTSPGRRASEDAEMIRRIGLEA
ncbi:MAG: biotin synthase BioB [Thaumarchaeota archaeon]|nr:biotin synthase BioB [Nitrososphaerota archaeon]MDD9812892.1 biotin synthase BioB [Nitrososphaerota archaeon]MDD9825696.1 biotin synthase BioB [Nitrososphaerota archaeon]MDD9843568.1 biotin synthase BioB [Nitrososphaerota archaeon]